MNMRQPKGRGGGSCSLPVWRWFCGRVGLWFGPVGSLFGPVGGLFGRILGRRVGLWFGHFVLMFSWVLYWIAVGVGIRLGLVVFSSCAVGLGIALGWLVFLTPLRSSR